MPDFIICGSCFNEFQLSEITHFIKHKQDTCNKNSKDERFNYFGCFYCDKNFSTPWSLLQHLRSAHGIEATRNTRLSGHTQNHIPSFNLTQPYPNGGQPKRTYGTQTTISCLKNCPDQQNSSENCCLKAKSDERADTASTCCMDITQISGPSNCVVTQNNNENQITDISTVKPSMQIGETHMTETCCEQMNYSIRSYMPFPRPNRSEILNCSSSVPSATKINNSAFCKNVTGQNENNFEDNTTATSVPLCCLDTNRQCMPSDCCLDGAITDSFSLSNSIHVECQTNFVDDLEFDVVDILSLNNDSNCISPQHNYPETLADHPFDEPGIAKENSPFVNTTTTRGNCESVRLLSSSSSLSIISEPQMMQQSMQAYNTTSQSPTIFPVSIASPQSDTSPRVSMARVRLSSSRPLQSSFSCNSCARVFRQKIHLQKHYQSEHIKDKPHKCHLCSYTTVEKSHLKVHMRIHTKERPYNCRICKYAATQNCTLKQHYIKKHPNSYSLCKVCASKFITDYEKEKHEKQCRKQFIA